MWEKLQDSEPWYDFSDFLYEAVMRRVNQARHDMDICENFSTRSTSIMLTRSPSLRRDTVTKYKTLVSGDLASGLNVWDHLLGLDDPDEVVEALCAAGNTDYGQVRIHRVFGNEKAPES